MAGLFQQMMYQLGIHQIKSSAYHPESQGALERFHQTLKNMLRTYCMEQEKEWDEKSTDILCQSLLRLASECSIRIFHYNESISSLFLLFASPSYYSPNAYSTHS